MVGSTLLISSVRGAIGSKRVYNMIMIRYQLFEPYLSQIKSRMLYVMLL